MGNAQKDLGGTPRVLELSEHFQIFSDMAFFKNFPPVICTKFIGI